MKLFNAVFISSLTLVAYQADALGPLKAGPPKVSKGGPLSKDVDNLPSSKMPSYAPSDLPSDFPSFYLSDAPSSTPTCYRPKGFQGKEAKGSKIAPKGPKIAPKGPKTAKGSKTAKQPKGNPKQDTSRALNLKEGYEGSELIELEYGCVDEDDDAGFVITAAVAGSAVSPESTQSSASKPMLAAVASTIIVTGMTAACLLI